MAYLKQINLYPVKSLAGVSVPSATVEERGLAFDRCLMLVDSKGKFITARKYSTLLSYATALVDEGIDITSPCNSVHRVKYSEFSGEVLTNLWREEITLKVASDATNHWFSDQLEQAVRLVMVTDQLPRYREKLQQQVSLSDGYPLLLIGQASLDELNRRASEPSQMDQFRTNLVIEGSEAFAEDCWQSIRIGEVIFELPKPCERCVMTTVDLATFKPRASKEPLATLATFRADPKGRLMFGENLLAKNSGKISVGDKIEVLTTRDGINYGQRHR